MTAITARLSTALADRYKIERQLGEGGMATVYLAEDLKHKRKVAVKVLRSELSAILGGERFLKEIEVTANLQHPNILPLYDSGEADSFLYYVMPFIEGETLRDKLNREKQLAVEETVEITKSVAAALSFAHGRGVVHRDIKPENILLQSGQALVADFGIALAVSQAGGTRITETGLSIGTPHYMSPEQAAADRKLDGRTDVYSLGAMTYEMLVGRPPFEAASVQAVMSKILTETAGRVSTERPAVPSNVDAAVHVALEKLPADRFPTAAQFADALANPAFALRGPDESTAPLRLLQRRQALAIGAAGALVGVIGFAATQRLSPARDPPPAWSASEVVAARLTNYGGREESPALSPDGRSFAFVSHHEGTADIYVRQVAGGELVRLTNDAADEGGLVYAPGGETIYFVRTDSGGSNIARAGAPRSIWRVGALGGQAQRIVPGGRLAAPSPDGLELAYVGRDSTGVPVIEVMALEGPQTRKIARAPGTLQLAWSPDGRYLAVSRRVGLLAPPNLYLVDAETGVERQVTWFTGSEEGIRAQAWLPESRHLVVVYQPKGTSIWRSDLGVLDTEDGSIMRLTMNATGQFRSVSASADGGRVVATLRTTGEELWRVPFGPDPDANGRAAVRILDQSHDPSWPFFSRDGETALFNNEAMGRNLWTLKLDGSRTLRQITALPNHKISHSALSPDGTRVAFVAGFGGVIDIWTQHVDGSDLHRLTDDDAEEVWPVWSPDGQQILYPAIADSGWETWIRPSDGGPPEKLRDSYARGDWIEQPDGSGTWLALYGGGSTYVMDFERRTVLWEIPTGSSIPVFSPDGRSISVILNDEPDLNAIWVVDATTGERRLAARFPERFFVYTRAGWALGGDAFVVIRQVATHEIVMFDGFTREGLAGGDIG